MNIRVLAALAWVWPLFAACREDRVCPEDLDAGSSGPALESSGPPQSTVGRPIRRAIGASFPCTDSAGAPVCPALCEGEAQVFRAPAPVPSLAFAGCANDSFVDVTSGTCWCGPNRDRAEPVPHGPGCAIFARDRRCLFRGDEYQGCLEAKDCRMVCEALEERMREDAARMFDVRVHGSDCTPGGCRCVLALGDFCFVNESPIIRGSQPCTTSAAEILRQDSERNRQAGMPPSNRCD